MVMIAVVIVESVSFPATADVTTSTTTSSSSAATAAVMIVVVVMMMRMIAGRSVDFGRARRRSVGVEDFEVVGGLDVLEKRPGAGVVLLAGATLHELGLC